MSMVAERSLPVDVLDLDAIHELEEEFRILYRDLKSLEATLQGYGATRSHLDRVR